MTALQADERKLVLLIGSNTASELVSAVQARVPKEHEVICVADQGLSFLGRIDPEQSVGLVVLFVSAASHNEQGSVCAEEAALVDVLRRSKIPCMIVYHYRLNPPP